jgi:hypothetical protein
LHPCKDQERGVFAVTEIGRRQSPPIPNAASASTPQSRLLRYLKPKWIWKVAVLRIQVSAEVAASTGTKDKDSGGGNMDSATQHYPNQTVTA